MSRINPDILIIGATGRIGYELVARFKQADIPVRLLLRSKKSSRAFPGNQTEIVYGDLIDRPSLDSALKNIKRVFMVTRDQPEQAHLEGNLINAAIATGVERIVKGSAFAAGLKPAPGYGQQHAVVEQKLTTTDMQWTILRPYMFMQNLIDVADLIKKRGILPLPLGDSRIAFIDARDVAAVAYQVLIEDGHASKIYELTGPEVLDMQTCAEQLSTCLGRTVRYRSPPTWLAGLIMRAQGVSAWDVRMRKELFQMLKDGGEAQTTATVKQITGHQPRTMAQFIQEHFKI